MKGPVLVMANLKARKLAGFESNGMVMANSNSDHSVIELARPKGQIGERITL
jgi:aminoacyl tRNA synthase complex-interacting multifunctional protein 1